MSDQVVAKLGTHPLWPRPWRDRNAQRSREPTPALQLRGSYALDQRTTIPPLQNDKLAAESQVLRSRSRREPKTRTKKTAKDLSRQQHDLSITGAHTKSSGSVNSLI